jgi:phenylalanyl-tRNA synthetase alpha chain
MDQNLDQIYKTYQDKISAVTTDRELELIRVELLGRNGLFNDLFSKLKEVSVEERRNFGQKLNVTKNKLERLISLQSQKVTKTESKIGNSKTGNSVISLPKIGHLHPITQTERQLNALFKKLGFSVYNSPEIVTDEYNFERLNVPKDHPARDMQDSIYIKEPEYLLRTQTSTIEAYLLAQKNKELPIQAAFAGSTFRNEKVNRSNHFVFHQYQAVVVDKGLTMKDLIGTMDLMFKTLYGPDVVVRYRCKYYPEVEPGVGPDMQCFSCHGNVVLYASTPVGLKWADRV